MGNDEGVVIRGEFDKYASLKQQLDNDVTEAFRAKELARAQVDGLTADIPENVKIQILLAASVYAQKLAAYVRARDAFDNMFPRSAA